MEETYDVIICGTGFKECILSGLFSVKGKKVLHIDRNDYYGGEAASLNLSNLFKNFNESSDNIPNDWGQNRDWNVDLIPKFIMSNGKLVQILLKTKVKNYIEFRSVSGSFVYQPQKGNFFQSQKTIHKIPSTETEILASRLIPLKEKIQGRSFFLFVIRWNRKDPNTWERIDPEKHTMRECFEKYGLDDNIRDFVGHSIALEMNDQYLDKPCGLTLDKIKLYFDSLVRFGSSPFLYPFYGLTTLPEGFSRLSAIHGGIYMLRTDIKQILRDSENKIVGILNQNGEKVYTKLLISDPSYALEHDKVRKTGKVIRLINILNAPIPDTAEVDSCQIILPQKQLNRKNDIYIAMIGYNFNICKNGKYIAYISTVAETDNPMEEIKPAIELLGPIEKQFLSISDIFEPIDRDPQDNWFVFESNDSCSHFEKATEQVINMWEAINKTPFDIEEMTEIT